MDDDETRAEVARLRAEVAALHKQAAKRWIKRAALVGMILGLLCNCLPHEYRAACHAVVNVCTP